MRRPANYNTKQREAILDLIMSLAGAHVSAAQIEEYFEREGAPIGRATIYRHLEKLTQGGSVRKYITDGISGACYQYVRGSENCGAHIHLKCEGCGDLLHIECEEFDDMRRHISAEHAFRVDAAKTVLYGTCDNCQSKLEACE